MALHRRRTQTRYAAPERSQSRSPRPAAVICLRRATSSRPCRRRHRPHRRAKGSSNGKIKVRCRRTGHGECSGRIENRVQTTTFLFLPASLVMPPDRICIGAPTGDFSATARVGPSRVTPFCQNSNLCAWHDRTANLIRPVPDWSFLRHLGHQLAVPF